MLKIILALLMLSLIAAGSVFWLSWRWSAAINDDIGRLLARARPVDTVITAGMLTRLPPPAQRYFAHAGVVGRPIPGIVRLTQSGRIRSDANAKWMNLKAEEFYSTDPPAFVWRAWFPTQAMPIVLGRDEYLEGKGSIVMKLLGVYPVADDHADDLGPAGLMRYLNEMMWFPAAYLGDNVRIAPVDDGSFTVSIADRGLTATGKLFIDAEGRLTNFRALRLSANTRALETWETPMTDYGERAGLSVPTAGRAVWKLAGDDFDYIELRVGEVAYDPPALR